MAMFGLSRTEVYQLIKDKKIRAIHDKKIPDSKHGVYRIYIDSVRQYLHALLEEAK